MVDRLRRLPEWQELRAHFHRKLRSQYKALVTGNMLDPQASVVLRAELAVLNEVCQYLAKPPQPESNGASS
jgi:hypothetical protein